MVGTEAILSAKVSDDNTSITLPGEFLKAALGYTYEMKIVYPQFYVTKAANQNAVESLDTANLIVHRVEPRTDWLLHHYPQAVGS